MKRLNLFKTFFCVVCATMFLQNVWAIDGARVTYNRGTIIEIPEAGFDLKLNVEINVSYAYTNVSDGGDKINSFDVFRERLTVSGNILNKQVSYYLQNVFESSDITAFNNVTTRKQFGVGNVAPTPSGSKISDVWIQYNFDENTKLRFGRQKQQFGYVLPSSTPKRQFLNRPLAYQITSEIYKLIVGSENGITGFYKIPSGDNSFFNSSIGFFNGDSFTADGGTSYKAGYGADTHVTGVLSANYVHNGFDRSGEGDVGHSKSVSWTAGLSGSYRETNFRGAYYAGQASIYNVGIDFGLRSNGFSIQAEVFTNIIDRNDASTLNNYGYYVQTGYFLIPKDIEVALRFSGVDMDKHFVAGGRESYEYSATLNKYIMGHNLKLQAGVSFFELKTGIAKHDELKFIVGICSVL